jgi:hypothetical protein
VYQIYVLQTVVSAKDNRLNVAISGKSGIKELPEVVIFQILKAKAIPVKGRGGP